MMKSGRIRSRIQHSQQRGIALRFRKRRVDRGQQTVFPVVIDQRSSLFVIDFQTVLGGFERIVGTLEQFAANFPERLRDQLMTNGMLHRFLDEAKLSGSAVPLEVRETAGFAWEEYRLTVEKGKILLEGSDNEAIRRGLYFVRDLLAGSPYLKIGVTHRKPWLRNRTSRCFFGKMNFDPDVLVFSAPP